MAASEDRTLHTPRDWRRTPSQRGTAYLLAVGLSLLVAVVATGTLLATRARFAGEADAVDLARVRAAAEGAVAVALARLNTASTFADGTVATVQSGNATIDGMTMRWRIEVTESAAEKGLPTSLIRVQADAGHARRRFEVDAIPARTPHSAFELALAVGGTLGLGVGSTLTIDAGDAATAGTLTLPAGSTLNGTVEQVATGSADERTAQQRTLLRPTMPTADQIASLKAAGEQLTVPLTGGAIVLSNLLLSPSANPYGALSQRGVYVLNAGGRVVTISGLRIVGTLIIVSPGVGSMIDQGMLGEAAVPGAPCLIVEGSLFLNGLVPNLNEAAVNFNPQGTPSPFVGGTVDSDVNDVRANRFRAPVVVTGTLSIAGTIPFAGVVVGGDCAIKGTVTVSRDDWAASSPPPELQAARWRLDRSTWTETLPSK